MNAQGDQWKGIKDTGFRNVDSGRRANLSADRHFEMGNARMVSFAFDMQYGNFACR
jgi:hypothetical protein